MQQDIELQGAAPNLCEMMQQIIHNQRIIAQSLGISLIDGTMLLNNNNVRVAFPLETLRQMMRYPDAFDKAVSAGLIKVVNDKRLISHFASRTQLAYFCGRLFCGDYPSHSVWLPGKFQFPDSLLNRLFGYSVRSLRKNKLCRSISDEFSIVDNLF